MPGARPGFFVCPLRAVNLAGVTHAFCRTTRYTADPVAVVSEPSVDTRPQPGDAGQEQQWIQPGDRRQIPDEVTYALVTDVHVLIGRDQVHLS
jgi:hypothetical protein